MIKRTPDFQAWGDSSLDTAGGFPTDLGFYWYLHWPVEITSKSLKFFKRKAYFDGEIVSINLLHKKLNNTYKYQTLLNWSDNKSAIAWTKQAAISTAGGKASARIFCSL